MWREGGGAEVMCLRVLEGKERRRDTGKRNGSPDRVEGEREGKRGYIFYRVKYNGWIDK